ncbi:MAG: hypothetical protein ACR2IV_10140 [Bryobacteraceae bacterium]
MYKRKNFLLGTVRRFLITAVVIAVLAELPHTHSQLSVPATMMKIESKQNFPSASLTTFP